MRPLPAHAALVLLAAGHAGGLPDRVPPSTFPAAQAPPTVAIAAEGERGRLAREHVVHVGTAAPFYSPSVVRVRVGDSVRWVNDMLADTHGVRDVRRGVFSFEIPPGGQACFRFREAGEYTYRCRFHPWMTGRVLVEPRRLEVAWRDLPAGFTAVRLVARADGVVVAVESGASPRAAAVRERGVDLLDASSQGLDGETLPATVPDGARSPRRARLLSTDADGTWLAGDDASLLHVGRDGRAVAFTVPLAGARVTALAADGRGSAWVVTNTNELVRVGALGADVFELAPAPERGTGLALDDHEGLWLLDAARARVGRVALHATTPVAETEAPTGSR